MLESPLSTVIQGRKIPPSPTSPAVLRKIEDWISKSREQLGHRSHQTNQGPTRILEIKENGSKVVLCELPSMQAEYSALSHCWGTLQPVTLTMDTLEDFRMGLKTSSLPETFQDAIWLANHLQIRYIWIDSLCIIQDCSDDWARESARMADIYGNSFLTIAACRSANTSNGFLNDRAERTYLPIPARLGNLFGEALAFTLPIKYAGNTRRCALLEGEPLTERGWAFQERYLARRTLHFGRSQIFFECDADFFPEDGCSYAQPLWSSEYILEDSSAGSSITCRQKWHRVIEQYSGRKLTLEDDKLPAVGGLAVRFALDSVTKNGSSILGNRYLAGLWWDNIIQDMCWRIETRKHSGERPRRYRAPTWSWASVNAVIEFFHTDTDLAVVQDAHVDLDTLENPLGRVIGGWIWLRALKFRAQGRTDSFLNHSLGLCEDGAEFSIDPDWDTDTYCAPKHGEKADHVKGETDLFVIPLAWLKGSWHSQPSPWSILGLFFLIVKAADHQVTSHVDMPGFQRVGSGTAHYTLDEGRREVLDLFVKKWTVAKERGELEDMIVL